MRSTSAHQTTLNTAGRILVLLPRVGQRLGHIALAELGDRVPVARTTRRAADQPDPPLAAAVRDSIAPTRLSQASAGSVPS